MRNLGYVVLLLLFSFSSLAQVTENFNHDDQSVSEGNCWQFNNIVIDKIPGSQSINTGTNFELGLVEFTGGSNTASLTGPYMDFSTANQISFNHKLRNASGTYSNITVQIIDPSGTVRQTILDHDYRSGNSNANGNPTNTINENINITYTGYGQVVFSWSATGTNTDALIDDISIDGTEVADESTSVSGVCESTFTFRDTVCSGDQAVLYTAEYNISSETYTWAFSGGSAGTIDDNLTTNDSIVEVTFDTISGDYSLVATEAGTGNQVVWEIHVNPLPSVSYSIDSVCLEEAYTMDLTLTGTGPWTLEYQYTGSGTQTQLISTSSYGLNLPGTADTFSFISLSDANGCSIDASLMPSVTVPYFPKPDPLPGITPMSN